MSNNAVLTKDVMIRRKWKGNPKCQFCESDESIDHLFFTCSVAKAIWIVIVRCIGANNIPVSLDQCWAWCDLWLLIVESYMYGEFQLFAGLSRRHETKPVSMVPL